MVKTSRELCKWMADIRMDTAKNGTIVLGNLRAVLNSVTEFLTHAILMRGLEKNDQDILNNSEAIARINHNLGLTISVVSGIFSNNFEVMQWVRPLETLQQMTKIVIEENKKPLSAKIVTP